MLAQDTMTIDALTNQLGPIGTLKNKLAPLIGAVGLLIMLAITGAGDMRPLADICDTDYVTALYVAGHMVNHGVGHDIYPDLKAQNFYSEKFAAYTRNLLNKPSKTWLYLFTYPPAVAMVTAPIAIFDPRQSLMLWQGTSIAALLFAALAFASMPGTKAPFWRVFLAAGLFFPVLDVIVVGQTSILIGLLPLCLGYYFWQREKYIATGLCWSILGLKPQIALPVAIICSALLLASVQKRIDKREALSIVAGGLAGTLALHLIPCLFLGMDSFLLWLNAVKMSGQAFASENTGYWQYHLFCSLPCLFVLALPKELWLKARMQGYLLGLAAMIAAIPLCARVLSLQVSKATQRDLLIILATPFIMISAPHLLLYDTCLMLLPAWILFYRLPKSRFTEIGRSGAIALLIAVDFYIGSILTQAQLPALGWQLALLAGLLIYTFLLFLNAKTIEVETAA